MSSALAVFWCYPTAPPRLLAPGRYVDVVAATHAFGSWHSGTLATAANQLAAMPSLHIAWAAWSALAAARIWGGPSIAGPLAVWVYPVLTAVAVMATGNHFLLDVLAGLVTMVVCHADRGALGKAGGRLGWLVRRWPATPAPCVRLTRRRLPPAIDLLL